jgi:asparagine synthase (glutamine-hydrolysing)
MSTELKTDSHRPTFSGCGMCGAVGFLGAPNALSSLDMPAMVKSMHHRGPNGNGIFTAPSTWHVVWSFRQENFFHLFCLPNTFSIDLSSDVSFGHTRLSILDLSDNGKQPMTKGEFTITYNGEVYNYPDLRSTLLQSQPNLKLDSTTDTEILVRSIEHCINNHSGEGYPSISPLLNTFNGFFAFGVWDASRQRLLVVRDRYGIKPLYYYHKKDSFFAFASEVETLLASKLFSPVVDMDTLHLFGNIGSFFGQTSKTLVEGVHSLNPGQGMWIDAKTGTVETFVYYTLPLEDPELASITKEEAVAHMKHLLEDSIQLRMVSDVPLSSFLSGGIDSSVITAIASHSAFIGSSDAQSSNIHSPEHPESISGTNAVTAYTVTYLGQGQNAGAAADEEYARKVSVHLGPKLVNHKFVSVDPMTFTLDEIDEISDLGTFSDDDRLLTVLMNYRAVKKEGFSVILNGQGADEAMGGYIGIGWFKGGMVDIQDPEKPLFDNVLNFIMDDKLFNEPVKAWAPKARESFHHSWAQYRGSLPQVAMQWLFNTSLHRILRFEDYLSMRSAVECRVPILDYRLVDFCFRLPWRIHCHLEEYTGKVLLRELSKAYLPIDVCERPKQTFPNVNMEALNIRLRALIIENLPAIRECPLIKYVWIAEVFATPEGLDKCTSSDFWVIIVYWRWWLKFASYGGSFPSSVNLA